MRDSDLSTCVQQCCFLIGCFVASQDYMPLLMAQLETAADPAAEGGCLAVWASVTQGAGEHYLCLLPMCLLHAMLHDHDIECIVFATYLSLQSGSQPIWLNLWHVGFAG